MELLRVEHVSKRERGTQIVQDVSFRQKRKQKIAIAGETGSGKSTLLKIIAGLLQPDEGQVLLEKERVKGPDEKLIPGHAGIAFLSQQFELRNHYRMEELLEYANNLPGEEAQRLYELCDISHLMKRENTQISGGERQRIALARLLTSSPRLLLLDEPFSNLDLIHKAKLKQVIRDISEGLGMSCILVSHEPSDILSWADEIILMRHGRIIQQGTPTQVYRQPVSEYAAALLGKYNLIPVNKAEVFRQLPGIDREGPGLLIRPGAFKISAPGDHTLCGKVKQVRFQGSYYDLEVALDKTLVTVFTENSSLSKGDNIHLSLSAEEVWYMNESGER